MLTRFRDDRTASALLALGGGFQVSGVLYVVAHFDRLVPRLMPDDAFYYLKIAENISGGFGSVFSVGDPTNGYHPLWMVVLLLIRLLAHPTQGGFVFLVLLVSVALNVIAAAFFARWLRLLGLSPTQQRFGIVLYLFNPWLVNLTLTGLETPLFLCCLFVFLMAHHGVMAEGEMDWRSAVFFGTTAGLLMLARTDSIFFTIPAFAAAAFVQRRRIRDVSAAAAISLVIVAPWLAWNLLQFGTIVQSSASAMSGLAHHDLPPAATIEYWSEAAKLARNVLMWLAVAPLWPHPRHVVEGFRGITLLMVVATAALGLVLWHKSVRGRLAVPFILYGPALGLLFFYVAVRAFMQVWHVSTLVVLALVLMVNYVPQSLRTRSAVITALCLSPLCWYTITNGYFFPQAVVIGSISRLQRYRIDAPPSFTSCATDAGLLGYFSTHTVVNVDGVVNNRAADSILAGRLSEYMAARGCDEVLMDPDRSRYYDRNVRLR